MDLAISLRIRNPTKRPRKSKIYFSIKPQKIGLGEFDSVKYIEILTLDCREIAFRNLKL